MTTESASVVEILQELEHYSNTLHIKNVGLEHRPLLVKILSRCTCCERHQVNRPLKHERWVDTPFNESQLTDCPCKCRIFSRWLCRPSE